MKKTFARFLSVLLAMVMLFGFAAVANAAEVPEEFDLFIAYGGDKEAENDWGYEYYGADTDKSAGITATNATIKVGETQTISLSFETANINSWFFAPCLVAEDISGITAIDYTITCKIDGQDVAIDMAADAEGKTWWTEGTGDYTGTQCIRLAGGYNEWATKYIAEPAGFTTIEYTITLNSVSNEPVVSTAEVPEEFSLFIAYGGDKEAENDWGYEYYGADTDKSAGITATNATIKVGETQTISLSFETANTNSWFFAPCLVAEDVSGISAIDYTITCKIDGQDVAIDMAADAEGKTWWTEGTGDYTAAQCIRLAGGYNEWATKYIAEPAGFTTIEYTITLNAVDGAVVEEVEETPAAEVDLNGTYNAYLLLQTPNWTYRDAWNSANGIGSEYWGNFIWGNDTAVSYGVVTDAVIVGNGTYTISITDFGTIFADDFAAAGQEYFNILGFTTDIPLGDVVKVSDVKLIIDGQERHSVADGYQNPDDKEYMNILIQNIWNDDVKEISYYPAPTTSLEIQFTVSGFAYDKDAGEVVETEPVETEPVATEPVVEQPAEKSNTGLIVGIIVAVIAVAAVVVVVLKKKKQ